MKKNTNEFDFHKIFKGKKIPILTLDPRWYELFPEYDKPSHIKEIEDKLNLLMQRQGKLVNDMKDYKNLKTKLMQEIITHMDINETEIGLLRAKKVDKNQKMIKTITEKLKAMEDELVDIPYLIKDVNEQLIIESANECYSRLKNNNQKVEEISQWIAQIREELKEKILLKQDREMKNNTIYNYMHDMLGPELLQTLDDSLKFKM
jgi:hypothetical protein